MILSINLILTAVAMNFLPDEMPLHYNAEGIVDRIGSKYELFTLTALAAVFVIFWQVLVYFFDRKARRAADEKSQKEAAANTKLLVFFGAFQTGIMTVIQVFFMLAGFDIGAVNGSSSDWTFKVLCIVCGVGFIAIGNVLPKTKRNGLIGLRTQWSMKNDVVWAKSNRFAGVLLCAAGVITVIEGALLGGLASVFAMLGTIIAVSVAAAVYSYIVYKQDEEQG